MPDELDPQLLRWFAQSRQPLADAQFALRVMQQLVRRRRARRSLSAARSIAAAILSGLLTGVAAPLRLRHARLLALAAAAVTLWSALQRL